MKIHIHSQSRALLLPPALDVTAFSAPLRLEAGAVAAGATRFFGEDAANFKCLAREPGI
jgi:hypothetical protein